MEDYHGGDGTEAGTAATETRRRPRRWARRWARARRRRRRRETARRWARARRRVDGDAEAGTGAAAAAWRRKVLLLPGRGSTRGTSAGIYRGRALVPGGDTDRY